MSVERPTSPPPATPPAAIPAPARRAPFAVWIVAALAGVALAAGAFLFRSTGEGTVELIRVSRHSMVPESLLGGTPDYYVIVGVKGEEKEPITLEGYEDTPIGNGLDFKLPKPLALEEIAHIELLDEDLASDDTRDRVDVRGRVSRGLEYEFELIGPPSEKRTAAYVALGAGGALLATSAILFIRSHAL
jgi:hypothetical protein